MVFSLNFNFDKYSCVLISRGNMVFSLNSNFDKYSFVLISRKIWSLVEILLETKISPVTPVIVGHVTTLPVMMKALQTKLMCTILINHH